MKPPALFQLLPGRVFAALTAVVLIGGIVILALKSRDTLVGADESPAVVCVIATFGTLISVGGIIRHALVELERGAADRVVPGLPQRMRRGVRLLVPLIAFAATGGLWRAIPNYTATIGFPQLLILNAFWLSVGIGLGWSWFKLFTVIAAFSKTTKLLHLVQTNPVWSNCALLAAIGVLFVGHERYSQRANNAEPTPTIVAARPFAAQLLLWAIGVAVVYGAYVYLKQHYPGCAI